MLLSIKNMNIDANDLSTLIGVKIKKRDQIRIQKDTEQRWAYGVIKDL